MKILAIDSTAIVSSAALCNINDGNVDSYCLFTVKNGLTHSENLLPLVDKALNASGAALPDVDMIAVSAGPGSFTGVRIGVATVKGLAFSYDTPVCGVSTIDALYENVKGIAPVVCPVMDARRSTFYNSLFVNGQKIYDDRCVPFEEIYQNIKDLGQKTVLCGDGARLFKSMCRDDDNVILPPVMCSDQNAVSVAMCGYSMFVSGKSVKQNTLQPIYLRPSQAERERNNKQ